MSDKKLEMMEARLARLEMMMGGIRQVLALEVPTQSAQIVHFIQRFVAADYELDLDVMLMGGRYAPVVWPRFIAIELCRRETALSLNSIGYHFKRGHDTIINASKSLRDRLDTDKEFKREFDSVARRLRKQLREAKELLAEDDDLAAGHHADGHHADDTDRKGTERNGGGK